MAEPDKIPNQTNYQDDQNFKIDINQIYQDYIQFIDKMRSVINISDPNNSALLKKFTNENFTGNGLSPNLKPEQSPQESRCHAFYRIIGFPVVASDYSYYNPGHDIVFSDRTIGISEKVAIANKPLQGFNDLSIKRENYINDKLKIFSNNFSIDAGVLALSTENLREFSAPFKKNTDSVEVPFQVENQSYEISPTGYIWDFKEYMDNSLNTPQQYTNKRSHIIKPFIVDARIDITTPSLQRVAIPFVPNDSCLRVSETGGVQRPLIEKIIVDRFSVNNNQIDLGTSWQDIINYVQDITKDIKNNNIVSQISSSDVFKYSEQQQFKKFLNIIRTMMFELYKAKQTIISAQAQYYWVPVPNENGPEFGNSVQAVFGNIDKKFLSSLDNAIIEAQLNLIISQIERQAAQLNAVPDVGGYALGNVTTTFDTNSASLGNINEEQLARLNEERNHILTEAGNSLKTIEIIMGEISGFGLCDIIAIMGALYIMPKKSLLGFLDDDAFARAQKNPLIKIDDSNPGVKTALDDLTKFVNDFYNLMDGVYKDISQNNQS